MKKISCIVVVGKPGAGKSSIGSTLANLLGGRYMSLGSFMRETLSIPDPHIGVDKHFVYRELHKHVSESDVPDTLVLDCHPYPEDDFAALQSFINQPSLHLWTVIHVDATDEVALERLERRPRPGQTYAERLKYYNDHKHLIDELMEHPRAVRVENNVDFEDMDAITNIAKTIFDNLNDQEHQGD